MPCREPIAVADRHECANWRSLAEKNGVFVFHTALSSSGNTASDASSLMVGVQIPSSSFSHLIGGVS
jgi:hypothetical protein